MPPETSSYTAGQAYYQPEAQGTFSSHLMGSAGGLFAIEQQSVDVTRVVGLSEQAPQASPGQASRRQDAHAAANA